MVNIQLPPFSGSLFLYAAMGNNLVVKVHCTLGSRKCWPNVKGVHREVESEGSRRQSSEPTNRNHIEAGQSPRQFYKVKSKSILFVLRCIISGEAV